MNRLPPDATAAELKAFIKAQESDYHVAKETMKRLQACFDEYELAKAVVDTFEHGGMTPLRDAKMRLAYKLLEREMATNE